MPAVIPVRETTLALAEIAVEESVVTEKYDDGERIITEAENAAFLSEEAAAADPETVPDAERDQERMPGSIQA